MMIDPSTLAFDIDGVIADTMGLFLDIAHDVYHINGFAYADIRSYDLQACLGMEPQVIDAIIGRILDGNYSSTLRPFDGAAEVLSRIVPHRNPLLLVTARPYPGPIRKWIDDLLPVPEASVEIVATGSFDGKAEVLLENGIRHFVEDRLETCFHLMKVGIEPVLFRQPWNRQPHPFAEVKNWRELETLVRFTTG